MDNGQKVLAQMQDLNRVIRDERMENTRLKQELHGLNAEIVRLQAELAAATAVLRIRVPAQRVLRRLPGQPPRAGWGERRAGAEGATLLPGGVRAADMVAGRPVRGRFGRDRACDEAGTSASLFCCCCDKGTLSKLRSAPPPPRRAAPAFPATGLAAAGARPPPVEDAAAAVEAAAAAAAAAARLRCLALYSSLR